MRLAGRLHNLGKVAARDERLRGDSASSSSLVAARILEPLKRHAEVTRIIRAQDEHWDTPRAEPLPRGAQIVAVVSRFDELSEGIGAQSAAEALQNIQAESGHRFDPLVVETLGTVVARRGSAKGPA